MNFNKELRKSFCTLSEMLRDRGVDTASLSSICAEDVIAIASSRNVFHIDLESCRYRVIWDMHPKFKLADIRKLLEEVNENIDTYVVIARDKPTHAALKGVEELGKDVQFFEIKELHFNISRHTLVPPHIPIRGEEDIEDIVRRYHLKTRMHLPIIFSSDPMARYLALKPGQLVKIVRPSPSAGTIVFYRCCAKGQ